MNKKEAWQQRHMATLSYTVGGAGGTSLRYGSPYTNCVWAWWHGRNDEQTVFPGYAWDNVVSNTQLQSFRMEGERNIKIISNNTIIKSFNTYMPTMLLFLYTNHITLKFTLSYSLSPSLPPLSLSLSVSLLPPLTGLLEPWVSCPCCHKWSWVEGRIWDRLQKAQHTHTETPVDKAHRKET